MKTQNPFGIAGLTRSELRSVQLILTFSRSSPENPELLIALMEEAVSKPWIEKANAASTVFRSRTPSRYPLRNYPVQGTSGNSATVISTLGPSLGNVRFSPLREGVNSG